MTQYFEWTQNICWDQRINQYTNTWTEIAGRANNRDDKVHPHRIIEYHPTYIIAILDDGSRHRKTIPDNVQDRWLEYLASKAKCTHKNIKTKQGLYSTKRYCSNCGQIL